MEQTASRKWSRRTAIAALIAVMMTVVSLVLSGTASAYVAAPGGKIGNRYLIPGHLVPALKHHTPLHGAQANRQLSISVALNLRNADELDKLITEQNDPKSSLYHQYLTPQEFAQRFSPSQATVNAVTAYLSSQGIKVNSVAPNNLLIDASGSLMNIESAFQVTIANYAFDRRTVYAPTDEPSVPTSLAGAILNISGLDDVAHYNHFGNMLTTKDATPQSGPAGGYTPTELRTAYDINPLISNGDNGSGQTVGIFELDGYKASDVNKYLSQYSLGSANYSNVLVDGATNTAGAGAVEVELDMEVVSAVAPAAAQKIYIGPNSTTGVNDLYNRIVSDNAAKVISISWGECESASGNSELSTLDTIFKQGAAQGQAFFSASGDSGAYDCNDNNLAVDSPADDPNVVGVGGTNLQTGSNGTYSSESAWSCPTCTDRSPKGSGGGGGISSYFARPSYQNGTNLTNANREVPDVSADADPNSGYSIYCTVTAAQCPSSGWAEVGGTSAAAPLWAGITADTNQYLSSLSKPTLGSASADLYTLYNTTQTYAAYHDVTTGNNLYYAAGTGYDLATGIGTPDVWNLARDLAGSTSSGGSGGGTTTQMLSNAGFENGQSPWQESSSGGYQIVDSSNPHAGSDSAYLCGYNSCTDAIWQTVTLPSKTTKVMLSYWLYISTQESGSKCNDNFYARIRNSSNAMITTAQTKCNTNASGWTQYTFDLTTALSSYSGQQIQVYFLGTTNASASTDFYVDDVALTVTNS